MANAVGNDANETSDVRLLLGPDLLLSLVKKEVTTLLEDPLRSGSFKETLGNLSDEGAHVG